MPGNSAWVAAAAADSFVVAAVPPSTQGFRGGVASQCSSRTLSRSSSFVVTQEEYKEVNESLKEKKDGGLYPKNQQKELDKRFLKGGLLAALKSFVLGFLNKPPKGPFTPWGEPEGAPGFELQPPKEMVSNMDFKAEAQAWLRDNEPEPSREADRAVVEAQLDAWKSDAQRLDELGRRVAKKLRPLGPLVEAAKRKPLYPLKPELEKEIEVLPISALYTYRAFVMHQRAKVAARIADNALLEVRKQQSLAHYWTREALKAEAQTQLALHADAAAAASLARARLGSKPVLRAPSWTRYPVPEDMQVEYGNTLALPGMELPISPVVAPEGAGVVRVVRAAVSPVLGCGAALFVAAADPPSLEPVRIHRRCARHRSTLSATFL